VIIYSVEPEMSIMQTKLSIKLGRSLQNANAKIAAVPEWL